MIIVPSIDKNTKRRLTVILAATCAVLQLAIAPNLPLFGGRYGTVSGFLCGLFFDFCSTSPLGLMAFFLTVCSYVLGMEVRNKLADDTSISLTQFSVAAFAVSNAYALALVLLGGAGFFEALFARALPTAAITIACYLPFVMILSRNRQGFTLSSRRGSPSRPGRLR